MNAGCCVLHLVGGSHGHTQRRARELADIPKADIRAANVVYNASLLKHIGAASSVGLSVGGSDGAGVAHGELSHTTQATTKALHRHDCLITASAIFACWGAAAGAVAETSHAAFRPKLSPSKHSIEMTKIGLLSRTVRIVARMAMYASLASSLVAVVAVARSQGVATFGRTEAEAGPSKRFGGTSISERVPGEWLVFEIVRIPHRPTTRCCTSCGA